MVISLEVEHLTDKDVPVAFHVGSPERFWQTVQPVDVFWITFHEDFVVLQ
jgi:hypothetical protein